MPTYNIADSMEKVAYATLRQDDWQVEGRSGVPDEWHKGNARVHFLHVGGETEMRWRRELPNTSIRVTSRKNGKWHKEIFSHAHQGSPTMFESWLRAQLSELYMFEMTAVK